MICLWFNILVNNFPVMCGQPLLPVYLPILWRVNCLAQGHNWTPQWDLNSALSDSGSESLPQRNE